MVGPPAIPGYDDTPFHGTTLVQRRAVTCPDTARSASASRCVRVPRAVSEAGVSPLAVAVFAVLEARHAPGTRSVTMPQTQIMTALGRRGHRPDRVRAAVTELVDAGVLRVWRARVDAEHTYELLVRGGREAAWDQLSMQLMAAMAAGECSPTELVGALVVDRALGRRGWTADTFEELGERMGCSARSMRRHVERLVAVGEVVLTRAGRTVMLSRPSAGMSSSDAPPTVAAPVQAPSSVTLAAASMGEGQPLERGDGGLAVGSEPATPGRTSPSEGVDNSPGLSCGDAFVDRNAGWSLTEMRPLRGIAPEDDAPENQTPRSPSRSDRLVRERASVATGGRKRPRPGPSGIHLVTRSDVAAIVRRLPKVWWAGPATRWRPGLAALLGAHLDAGVSAELLVAGVARFADEESHRGRLRDAAAAGITTLLRDVRMGLACRECGSPDVIGGSGLCGLHGGAAEQAPQPGGVQGSVCRRCGSHRGVRDGLCWRHQPGQVLEHTVGVEPEHLQIKLLSWASLRGSEGEIRAQDPQLAAWLDEVGWSRLHDRVAQSSHDRRPGEADAEVSRGKPDRLAGEGGREGVADPAARAMHDKPVAGQPVQDLGQELLVDEAASTPVEVVTDGVDGLVDPGPDLVGGRASEELVGDLGVGRLPVGLDDALKAAGGGDVDLLVGVGGLVDEGRAGQVEGVQRGGQDVGGPEQGVTVPETSAQGLPGVAVDGHGDELEVAAAGDDPGLLAAAAARAGRGGSRGAGRGRAGGQGWEAVTGQGGSQGAGAEVSTGAGRGDVADHQLLAGLGDLDLEETGRAVDHATGAGHDHQILSRAERGHRGVLLIGRAQPAHHRALLPRGPPTSSATRPAFCTAPPTSPPAPTVAVHRLVPHPCRRPAAPCTHDLLEKGTPVLHRALPALIQRADERAARDRLRRGALLYLPEARVTDGAIEGLGVPRYLPSSRTPADLDQAIRDHVTASATPRDVLKGLGPWIAGPVVMLLSIAVVPDLLAATDIQRPIWLGTLLYAGLLASTMHLLSLLTHAIDSRRATAAREAVTMTTRQVPDERAMTLHAAYTRGLPPAESARIYDELLDLSSDPDRAWLIDGAVDHMRRSIEERRLQAARTAEAAAASILAPQTSPVQDVLARPAAAHPWPVQPAAGPR